MVEFAAATNCRNCRFWKPLFSGEYWNVRSFADAPKGKRERILSVIKRVTKSEDKYYGQLKDTLEGFGLRTDGESQWPQLDWPMWGDCTLAELDTEDTENTKQTLAMAVDGSGYMASLRCRANFRCVQWKAMEHASGT